MKRLLLLPLSLPAYIVWLDFQDQTLRRWKHGASFRLGPLLLQVTRGRFLEMYARVGPVSVLVTI